VTQRLAPLPPAPSIDDRSRLTSAPLVGAALTSSAHAGVSAEEALQVLGRCEDAHAPLDIEHRELGRGYPLGQLAEEPA